MSEEIKSFRLYRRGKKNPHSNGGLFKWLFTTGPEAKNSATKFFAVMFSLAILVFFIGEGLGIGKIKVPQSAEMLLTIFWCVYIGSNKAKDIVSAARKTAPPQSFED